MDVVEDDLQGCSRWLRFAPALEARFERDSADERCRKLVIGNYASLGIYHLFLIGDYQAIRDAFSTDLLMHFAVMTPLTVVMNRILLRRPPAALREGLMTLVILVMAVTIALVVEASQSPLRDLIQFTIMLVILFATVVQRLRFWYAVFACIGAQVIYSMGLDAVDPMSADRLIVSNFIFSSVAVFSLIGCYNLEQEMRAGYLLRLRDRFRNQALEAISLRDALTGVGNRRALDEKLNGCVGRSLADLGSSTAVLLFDIDHFKTFNDANGHLKGDICLTRITGLAALALRGERGEVYRFGGEEFVVVLDDMALEAAVGVAERVRAAVERAAIPRGADGGIVTISVGAAAGRLAGGATPTSLVADADAALYAAKRRGRNLVWPAALADDMRLAG